MDQGSAAAPNEGLSVGALHGANHASRQGPHQCSFCTKSFRTLQSLGGHLTSHRREIEEMRRQHKAFMDERRAGNARTGGSRVQGCSRSREGGLPMVPLAANNAYWEGYRRAGHVPEAINFIQQVGNQRVAVETVVPQRSSWVANRGDGSSDKTITDPIMMPNNKEEAGEEVNSVDLDLTLKL